MTNLFIAYVAALLLPLLFHSWKVAIISLGVQGFLMGFLLIYTHEESLAMGLEALNLFVIRGIFVPLVLLKAMRTISMPPDFTFIKKSVTRWLVAFSLVVLAFGFAWKLTSSNPVEALQVGTAAAAILLSLHVLANQSHPLGQIIGLLTFEGGLTLVELLSPHAMPMKTYVGVSIVFVILVLTCTTYLPLLLGTAQASSHSDDEVVL